LKNCAQRRNFLKTLRAPDPLELLLLGEKQFAFLLAERAIDQIRGEPRENVEAAHFRWRQMRRAAREKSERRP
jgi:hypothetical protein